MRTVLKGWRNRLGLQQSEMANKINCNTNTYGGKERGNIPMKDYEMEIIHGLVKKVDPSVSIEELFFSEE